MRAVLTPSQVHELTLLSGFCALLRCAVLALLCCAVLLQDEFMWALFKANKDNLFAERVRCAEGEGQLAGGTRQGQVATSVLFGCRQCHLPCMLTAAGSSAA